MTKEKAETALSSYYYMCDFGLFSAQCNQDDNPTKKTNSQFLPVDLMNKLRGGNLLLSKQKTTDNEIFNSIMAFIFIEENNRLVIYSSYNSKVYQLLSISLDFDFVF